MVGAESAITNGVQGVDTNDQSASFEEVGPGGRLGSGRPVSPVGCPDTVASTRLDDYLVPLGDQRLNSLGGDGYPAIAGPPLAQHCDSHVSSEVGKFLDRRSTMVLRGVCDWSQVRTCRNLTETRERKLGSA